MNIRIYQRKISYISYENYRQNSLVSRSFSMFHSSLTKEFQIKKKKKKLRLERESNFHE